MIKICALVFAIATGTIACKARTFGEDTQSLGLFAKRVNPNAFNAFKIWRDGLRDEKEILDYPIDWWSTLWNGERIEPDDVFYFDSYWQCAGYKRTSDNECWRVKPTDGVIVSNNVLIYPPRNGFKLRLKFSALNSDVTTLMNQMEAAKYCKNKNLRLPSIRELFDFCRNSFEDKERCGRYELWSSSLLTMRWQAWTLSPIDPNQTKSQDRKSSRNAVICVGSE